MSVRPVTFQTNGDIDCVYDELGHSGTIPAAEVVWAKNMDGTDNHNAIILNCPDGCGASSTHPVGGGAAPLQVQQMFVGKVQREGCACGKVASTDTNSLGESHVHLSVNKTDGAGRWAYVPPEVPVP